MDKITYIKDVMNLDIKPESQYIKKFKFDDFDFYNGLQKINIYIDEKYYYENLSELCGEKIMDEYELTQQSRDRAQREFQKKGDEIIWDASRKAEDIYAASIMYTGEALRGVNDVIDETNVAISKIYTEMTKKLKEQEKIIKGNQLKLASELQDLRDTDK